MEHTSERCRCKRLAVDETGGFVRGSTRRLIVYPVSRYARRSSSVLVAVLVSEKLIGI